jgi:hypothetical protein
MLKNSFLYQNCLFYHLKKWFCPVLLTTFLPPVDICHKVKYLYTVDISTTT